MLTNTLNSVSLNPEAGTNFSPSLITIFLFPYLIFVGTRSGAIPGQVRCKSGASPAVVAYLEGSTYGFPTGYLSSIYGVAGGSFMHQMVVFSLKNILIT